MKNNILKYIFFIFIIAVAIFVTYKINKSNKEINQENTTEVNEEKNNNVEQTINLGIVEFDTINPIISKNKYVQDISKLIYEPLISINESYELEGVLAEEWAKTSETTYIIKLKENIKWSNGENVTSQDVLYTIDQLKALNEKTIYVYNVQYVIQAEIIDNYRIKITLNREVPFFEYNLNFPIMSKNYYGDEDFQHSEKTKTPIGTGKYVIKSIENSQILLEKNENYWNKSKEDVTLKNIKIALYSNTGEIYNDFKLGKIDLINTTNINIEDYIGTIGYNKVEEIGREYDYLVLNTQNAVLSNQEVRQAISYAIDKNSIISNIFNGKYKLSNFPLTYNNWLYQGSKENNYDAQKAQQILKDNGWEYKYNYWQKYIDYYTRRLNFKLVVKESDSIKVKVAELIKQQLESIGIKITIIKANENQYQNYKNNKNYDMILCGTYIGTSPDLTTYFGDGNLSNYNNEEMCSILNDVKNITDNELLKEKYKRIYEIYMNDVPYISLYNSYELVAYNKNLSGSITANWYNIFSKISTWYKK